jgi:hypothetical protein
MSEVIKLSPNWGLRRLVTSEPAWAIQYMGMDWLRISEFTDGTTREPLDDSIRQMVKELDEERPLLDGVTWQEAIEGMRKRMERK